MSNTLGLYLHFPFCLSKCLYCDFCSFPRTNEEQMRRYTDELCRRLRQRAPSARDRVVDTVYLGGGTPTLVPVGQMEGLMRTLREAYRLSPDCEITCECNPATADRPKLDALRTMGINRLSIGLQSIHPNELQALGRAHSFEDFCQTAEDAKDVGFDNFSADLMYGLPHQTEDSFLASIRALAALSPAHVSAYGLKIEEGTPFFRMQHTLALPDEDTQADLYLLLSRELARLGYRKYEISNFAKKGKHSRHNLRYWLGEEYLGFGVAAHSYFEGVRFGNSGDFDAFLRGEDITAERHLLSPHDQEEEYVMLRLRLADGIDTEDFLRRTGQAFITRYPTVRDRLRQGLMHEKNGRIAFTDQGFLVSNAILAEMLDFE